MRVTRLRVAPASPKIHRMTRRDGLPDFEGADIFSNDGETARDRFLAACGRFGVRVRAYPGDPAAAPDGGAPPFADVARLGPPGAKRVVMLCSGAKGSASLTAAGIALGCLERGLVRAIPRDVALVLVHAVNMLGPSWQRFRGEKDAGGASGDARAPTGGWDDPALKAADARFARFQESQAFDRDRLSRLTLSSMAPPAWTRETAAAIVDRALKGAERVLVLDIRTGPGKYGAMEIFPDAAANGADWARVATWLGRDPAKLKRAQSIGGADTGCGFDRLALAAGVPVAIPVAVEFGTYSAQYLLEAIGEQEGKSTGYPKDMEWRAEVWRAARALIEQALSGIAGKGIAGI